MLENLVTKKTTVKNANADQISFIINLMNGYNESKLINIKAVKNELFRYTVLTKVKKAFLDIKKYSEKGIRSFLPDKFREYISNKEKGVLLNAMNLHNGRNKIIGETNETIGERVTLKRQKADDKTDEKGDEQLDTTDMPDLETEKSAEQRRKHKGQGLKQLQNKCLADYQFL